jgi:DNA-3-methyladenine glycosylase I
MADERIPIEIGGGWLHEIAPVKIGFSPVFGTFTNQSPAETTAVPETRLVRCPWSDVHDENYRRYHDTEWGVPVHDDRRHFEFLVLEGAQAGLSWSTILRKRGGYRRAFAGFDPVRVARFNSRSVGRLLADSGIVRNRLKIEAAITNARRFLDIQREFGSFDAFVWRFVGSRPIVNAWVRQSEVPATSAESDALSADLKSRGFKFVGTTIIYAHMQATGLINDHIVGCFRHSKCGDRVGRRRPQNVSTVTIDK